MNARLNRLRSLHNALKRKLDRSSKSQRKARTRTLIQLGGLVHKCGLTERFGIELGEDLQVDEKGKEKAGRLEGWLRKKDKENYNCVKKNSMKNFKSENIALK